MRNSYEFRVGDKVVTLVSHEGIELGTVGTIASRWVGSLYAVKLSNGKFHWFDSTEIGSINPNQPRLSLGNIAVVTSDEHQHPAVKKGDLVQVIKRIERTDYYGVILNGELHFLAGFELAHYI